MPISNDRSHRTTVFARPVLGVVALALAIVALLALIAQSDWFRLRPASGSANAMSQAADLPGTEAAAPRPGS